MEQAAQHSADDGGGEGLHHFRAGARAPHDRQEAGDDGGDGHHFRAQAQARAFLDGDDEIGARERSAEGLALLLQRLFEIHDHDHAGLDRGAEERDVADGDGGAEIVAESVLQEDAAGEREGHGEDDVRGFLHAAIDDVEQQENHDEHAGNDEPHGVNEPELVFVFAGEFKLHTGRARDGFDAGLHFLHEAGEVAALHVGLHVAFQAAVF